MITQEVIDDIYRNYHKQCRDVEELRLPYFVELLSPYHDMHIEGDMVIVDSIKATSPFHKFLMRGLCTILEFARMVAMVFPTHIIFFSKRDRKISVNFRPLGQKRSWKERLFGRRKKESPE